MHTDTQKQRVIIDKKAREIDLKNYLHIYMSNTYIRKEGDGILLANAAGSRSIYSFV